MKRSLLSHIFLLFFSTALVATPISYSVEFIGAPSSEVLTTLQATSDLKALEDKLPASINALRFRAESDIPVLLKALHAHGYYEADVDVRIDEFSHQAVVSILIHPGPLYMIGSFSLTITSHGSSLPTPPLESLGITLNAPASASSIIEAEEKLLNLLANEGYPFAHVEKREVIADGATKTLQITLEVEAGALSRFGELSISGNTEVKNRFIKRHKAWKQGDAYDSSLVEKSQSELLDTGLFTSVVITHGEPGSTPNLPMQIEVSENKHKSIGVGVSYQTFFGPGLTLNWENRNLAGMGRKLSLQGDITRRTHAGTLSYLVPDCFHRDQDYVASLAAMREAIFPYSQRSYSVTNRFERKIGVLYRASIGAKVERLIVGDSAFNGTTTLLEVPLYFRFSSADDLLNPMEGATFEITLVPSVNFGALSRYYLSESVAMMFYGPKSPKGVFLLAQQLLFESIWSPGIDAIPLPKRVLGGSEQTLRGYRYRSVSPLEGHKPLGGRSGLFYTLETRFRASPKLGFVPFFDLGNVASGAFPKWRAKWFTSVGLGLRYFSFLGPIRFDIAFPLDRRKGIDPHYRVLASIGQTF